VRYGLKLLLTWVFGSVCWIAYWVWHYGENCTIGTIGDPSNPIRSVTCHWTQMSDGGPTVVGQTAPLRVMAREMAVTGLGPPGWALLAGVVLYCAVLVLQRRARTRS
jgi:hypothetical protein